jgi:hypothetical protein
MHWMPVCRCFRLFVDGALPVWLDIANETQEVYQLKFQTIAVTWAHSDCLPVVYVWIAV